ncbi:MAG: antibiotic biosynthesis monooxygenase [Eubacteriales bacterium]|jgi:autoinducer 2-degrading protein
MIATLVYVDVLPEHVEAFKKITLYNHENSRREPGNIRFDLLQSKEDPTKFVLYEVFADEQAAADHKKTPHYLRWRDEVAPYMASPRRALPTTPLAFD